MTQTETPIPEPELRFVVRQGFSVHRQRTVTTSSGRKNPELQKFWGGEDVSLRASELPTHSHKLEAAPDDPESAAALSRLAFVPPNRAREAATPDPALMAVIREELARLFAEALAKRTSARG